MPLIFLAGTSDDASKTLPHDIAECMSASARVYAILIKSLVAGRRADRRRKGIALSSSFNLAALQRQKHTHARGGGGETTAEDGVVVGRRPQDAAAFASAPLQAVRRAPQNPPVPPFFSGKQFEIFAVPHPQVERKF